MQNTLKFGTSGLRDTVTNMTDRECYINTAGFISFLKERGEISGEKSAIAIAGDLRSSTPRIMAAVAAAARDSGCAVVSCGNLPSPALAYFAMSRDLPSVMVTGSHIPDDRNGIKFTKVSGEVLKTDEQDILRNVSAVRHRAEKDPRVKALFGETGMFISSPEPAGREAEKEALKLYRERYTGVFPEDSLKGLKVVFYEHSAVGRDIIAEILEKLGATLIRVSRSDKFVPVDTEKISKETLELLKKWSSEHRPFAIVSTDGDSDRPLVADEKGAFIPGDKLGALAAMYLNPDFAAVPVSANDAVVSALTSRGVKVKQTRIGSPYVVKAMIDEMATSPSSKTVSWESNGGFLLGSAWVFAGKKLKELPTRDAVLPIVTLLMMAKKRGKAISEIVSEDMPARYTDAGVADNGTPGCEKYTAEMGTRIINAFSPARKDILEAVFSKGEVKVPGADISQADKENLKAIKDRLSSYFDRSKGFGEIKNINFVDGIRVYFEGGDVVHLRPSGNAPEFRLYATADTTERAGAIVSLKDKILPLVIKDISVPGARSVGAMASSECELDEEIVSSVSRGEPFLIEPYREPKVWGVGGIGEYWYGPGDEEKSSLAVIAGKKVLMGVLVSSLPEDVLGGKVIEKFGVMAPLVKILTPKGRLSVQFHDAKNELWIVTSCDNSLVEGGKNWIILGFSAASVEKYGNKVTEHYGKALGVYGKTLNAMISAIEACGQEKKDLLKETRDVLSAAEKVKSESPAVAGALKDFLKAKSDVEYFYSYRQVNAGDVIPVPSGTLHAMGPGVYVIEPQIAGPTQSLEDGTTYPVRYYFPGYQREDAVKRLDIDRVGEMRPEVTTDIRPETVEKGEGYIVDRLPGDFADKGLEAHRIKFVTKAFIRRCNNDSMHSFSATMGEAFVDFSGKSYTIPKAAPGASMLIVPASCGEYVLRAGTGAEIIDTFTPVS